MENNIPKRPGLCYTSQHKNSYPQNRISSSVSLCFNNPKKSLLSIPSQRLPFHFLLSMLATKCKRDIKNKVKIYPNPFQSSLNIEFGDSNPSQKIITLFDVNGRSISTQKTSQNLTRINVRQLIKGSYIIRIQDINGKIVYSGKVVKE
ncbi:MAG: T9SS type A sorting domain-containing protein [Ginsengibacter sp.]